LGMSELRCRGRQEQRGRRKQGSSFSSEIHPARKIF
jgi:hypothetical protein